MMGAHSHRVRFASGGEKEGLSSVFVAGWLWKEGREGNYDEVGF